MARKQLKEALEDEPSDPTDVALTKSKYIEALQEQLNYHETLRRMYATFLTEDSKNELLSDSLLSAEEIAQLNSNIMPVDTAGRPLSLDELRLGRNRLDYKTGYQNTGEGFFKTPARLKQHQEAVKRLASELSLPDGWAAVLDDEEALAEIAKIPGRLERQAAYKAYALNSRPRHLVIKHSDPKLAKHNMMFELTADDASLIPTPEEINTVLNSFTKFNDVIDISNLQGAMPNSLSARWNPEGVLDVVIGTHIPLREGDIGKNPTYTTGANASTSVNGDLYINVARMRKFDSPEFRETKEGFYWRDPEDSSDKLASTLHHELGHQVHYSVTDVDGYDSIKKEPLHLDEEGEVNTEYAQTNETEHFAESISRFIATGEATDRVKRLLSDGGLIKSAPEQPAAQPQKLVMPKPEDGGSNKTVEASTLSRKIKSLRESIASGEDIQNSRRSRGKEEDPDVAKFLDRDYKELKGLEFIEAYRKQTGKDRVSAPRSVFEGTHPMFDTVEPTPDAEASGPKKVIKKRNRIDFDDDDNGQIEPSEIAAAAKALAASAGHGMKLDGIKSAPVLATNGREVKIEGSSTLKAQAPSQQAIEVKNSVISLGTALLDSAMQTVERKLKERGIPSDGISIQDYIREQNKKDLAAIEAILGEVVKIKNNISSMRDAEIDKLAATITDAQFQRYLANRRIPKEVAETLSLEDTYDSRYTDASNNYYWRPDSIDPLSNKATKAFFKKALMFDAGNGYTYPFVRSNMPYNMTYRQRIAAILINDTKKLSDFPEISELAAKAIALRKEAEKIKSDKFEGEYKAMVRDSIVDEMKKAGVEFDSVDMSSVVGGVLPVRRYNRDPNAVDVVTGYAGLDEKLKEELQKAFEYIPKDILLSGLKNLQDGNGKIGIKYSEARAHFYESRNGGIIRGNDADDFLHEFWHFFQAINPDIVVLEHAFIYDRLKDSNGNLPKTEKKDQDFQFLDGDFTSAYTTKQYPNKNDYFDFSPLNRATEVSTVGMQDLFTSPNDFSVNSDKWPGILYVTIGKGKEKKVYENPHMDIATGIWYSDESMTEMLPGQGERSSKVVVKGRRRDLGVDKEFRAFNIGLMLSLLDWSSK